MLASTTELHLRNDLTHTVDGPENTNTRNFVYGEEMKSYARMVRGKPAKDKWVDDEIK